MQTGTYNSKSDLKLQEMKVITHTIPSSVQNASSTRRPCYVQASDRAPPWSCAKQLSGQLEPPTPTTFPIGIAPTPRGTPQKRTATYPQDSQLHSLSGNQTSTRDMHDVAAALPRAQTGKPVIKPLTSPSSQHQPHQSAIVSSSAAAQDLYQGDAELASACQQLAQAANIAAASSKQQLTGQKTTGAAHLLQNWTDGLRRDEDLPSACQQLAESVAAHAEQRASLQQAFEAMSADQPLLLTNAAVTAANAEPRTSQDVQGSSAEFCADLLQAAESCQQEGNLYQGSKSPRELAIACEQLTEVVSAHASQQRKLQQLLQEQQQLATSSSREPSIAGAAKRAPTQPSRHTLPTWAERPVSHKDSRSIKPCAKKKQRSRGADTAAWPPGPPQQARSCLLQATPAQEAAKSPDTQAEQLQDAALFCLPKVTHTQLGEQASADHRQLAHEAASQAQSAAAVKHAGDTQHVTVAEVSNNSAAGSPPLLQSSRCGFDLEIRQTTADCSNSCGAHLEYAALASSNGAVASGPTNIGPGVSMTESAEAAEPSFGAVHAMLSALQLPIMNLAEGRERTSSSCVVSLPHTCGLGHESAMLDTSPENEHNGKAPGTHL